MIRAASIEFIRAVAAQNLPGDLVMAPHPELQAIDWSARPLLTIRQGRAQASDMVSVQHGFAAIADYLADDYQLGNQIHRAGWRLESRRSPTSAERRAFPCWRSVV